MLLEVGADMFGNKGESGGPNERHGLVRGAMICPEIRAIEGERSAGEWHPRQILHLGRFFPRVKPRDAPIFIWIFYPAEDVDHSVNKDMTADLRADIDGAQDPPIWIELQNSLLVPLTQVEMRAIVTEV